MATYRTSSPITILSFIFALILACFSVFYIEKNTSAFFLPEDHPSRVQHSAHKAIFSRTAYSTFVLLRLNSATDIFNNESVNLLRNMHSNLAPIDLLDLLPVTELETTFGNEYNFASQSKEDLINTYNQLSQTYPRDITDKLLGQYLFPIKAVKSLLNTDNIYDWNDELIVESSYELQSAWNRHNKSRIANNELLKGSLFSSDEHGLIMQLEFAIDEDNTDLNLVLFDKLKFMIEQTVEHHSIVQSVHYAGGPVLNNAISLVMEQDNATYFPLVILFVLLTLTLFYRSALCAIYGLSISVLSILFTMALMPILGISLNIVTTILPVFIITIAVTDAIHVMSDVRSSTHASNSRAVSASINKLLRPMFLTSLTTGIGFLSLTLTEVENIRSFGLMVAISVVIAFLLSVTILPSLLRFKPITKTNHDNINKDSNTSKLNRFIQRANSNAIPALICATISISLISYGLPKLIVDQASIEAFDQDSNLRIDNDAFVESGTGSVMFNIWFKGDSDSAILDPSVLNTIKTLQSELKQHPLTVDSSSLIDFLQRTHEVLEKTQEEINLNERERVRQYLLLLEGGSERDLDSIVSVGDYKHTRIALSLAKDNSTAANDIIKTVDKIIKDQLPNNIEVDYAGYASIVVGTADAVLESQLNSLFSSLIAIIAVFAFVFRSASAALVGMIPLSATLATMFGIMGVLQFPLDVGSSLVAGIAFGIGIDYAIHLIEAVRRNASLGTRKLIIKEALNQVSTPITLSALVLSTGFSLLLLSSFKSLASLGLLVMVSMLVSAVYSLLIVPQVMRMMPAKLFASLAGINAILKDADHDKNSSSNTQTLDEEIRIIQVKDQVIEEHLEAMELNNTTIQQPENEAQK